MQYGHEERFWQPSHLVKEDGVQYSTSSAQGVVEHPSAVMVAHRDTRSFDLPFRCICWVYLVADEGTVMELAV
jgi:hypothetical protein